MAYQTGTVDDYRQLLKTFATFVTADAGLVLLGENWALNTGRVSSQAVEYLTASSFSEDGLMQWDKSVAMGWDDTFASTLIPEGYYGWRSYTTDLPDDYLGFESAAAVLPDHYIITAVHWDAGTSEADQQPETWFLDYSDDGSIWTEGDDVSTAGGGTYGDQTTWTSQEARTFDVPTGLGTHVYWRLRFVTNNGDATYLSLGRLRFYNSTPDWISYSYSNEYQFVAPGYTTTEEIYTGIRLYENTGLDYFNWKLQGAIGYDDTATFDDQPINNGNSFLTLYDQPLQYWLCANGQRAVMVVKVSTVYVLLYLGKYLPYGTPAQVPYPLIVAGNTSDYTNRWSETTTDMGNVTRCITISGSSVMDSSNNWKLFATDDLAMTAGSEVHLMPNNSKSISDDTSNMYPVHQNPDGTYCIIPYMMFQSVESVSDVGIAGELEGLFWVTGKSNLSGNIITIDAQDYLVFQNIYKTTWDEYSVLELK